MLTRLFTCMLFAAVLLGLAGQGVAQASVPRIANAVSLSSECMDMMTVSDTGKDTGKKSCRYSDCLAALSGCSSMLALSELPSVDPQAYSGEELRFHSVATTLSGWVTTPATAPPKSSI